MEFTNTSGHAVRVRKPGKKRKTYKGQNPYEATWQDTMMEGISTGNSQATYFLPEPNDDACRIEDLKMGRSRYESHRLKHSREVVHVYAAEHRGIPVQDWACPDWRQSLVPPDRYALVPIFVDPAAWVKATFLQHSASWDINPLLYWHPDWVQDYIMSDSEILSAIVQSPMESYSMASKQRLHQALLSMFVTHYHRDHCHQLHYHWDIVLQSFVNYRHLIAEWCLASYDQQPWMWYEIVMKSRLQVTIPAHLQAVMQMTTGLQTAVVPTFIGSSLPQEISTGNQEPNHGQYEPQFAPVSRTRRTRAGEPAGQAGPTAPAASPTPQPAEVPVPRQQFIRRRG